MTHIWKKDNSKEIRKVTWVGLLCNALLTIVKFVGGILGHSQALIADALHSTSDFLTDIAVILGSHFWNLPPDENHPYGHRRFETIITIGIGIAVAIVGFGIGEKSIESLLKAERNKPEFVVAFVAFLSVLSKEFLFRYTKNQGLRMRSQALTANAYHHRSDALSSIPVLIASIIFLIFPQLWFIDAIAALIVAFLVLHSAYEIALPGIKQLVDEGVDKSISDKLIKLVLTHPDVISVHGFRTRYVGSDLHVDLHIVVDSSMSLHDAHEVSESVEMMLILAQENIVDALVHVDPYDSNRALLHPEKTYSK